MGVIGDILVVVVVIVVTMFLCYWTTGISNIAGTVFEKKSSVGQREAERSTVKGGEKRQSSVR